MRPIPTGSPGVPRLTAFPGRPTSVARPRLVGLNHVEVVDYREIQFTKAENVLRGMGLDGLEKNEAALAELRAKGLLQD